MSEPSPEASHEIRKRYKRPEEAHRDVVGIKIPRTPEEAPETFNLNLAATGNLFKYMEMQDIMITKDTEKSVRHEWAQAVGILSKTGNLTNSPMHLQDLKFDEFGSGAAEAFSEVGRWFNPLIGKYRKPISYVQLHTPRHSIQTRDGYEGYQGGATQSNTDISQRIAYPNKSFVYVVAAPDGISVILQTEVAINKKHPIFSGKVQAEIAERLWKKYTNRDEVTNEAFLARYLKRNGYVLYKWIPETPNSTVIDTYHNGAFINGIPLKQVV